MNRSVQFGRMGFEVRPSDTWRERRSEQLQLEKLQTRLREKLEAAAANEKNKQTSPLTS
jgi:hypothetical protein